MLPVRSHDHHAAVWAHHAEYERRLHSPLDASPKDVAKQFIHFLVPPRKSPRFWPPVLPYLTSLARPLRRAFLHLRFCMPTTRTIENEYLRNPFDVQDGADKIHRLRQWHIGGADRSAQGIYSNTATGIPPANLV